jgi:EpsG family
MYLFVFFSSVLLSSISLLKKNITFSILLIIILGLFAGTRTLGVDRDYQIHEAVFENSPTNFDIDSLQLYEPTFIFLPILFHFIFGKIYFVQITFLFYSFLAVSTKITSFKNSNNFFLSVCIYCSYLFFSQEMTTIRAGVACAVFLYSIKDLVDKNDKAYFSKILVSLLFHYSSVVFILVWIITRVKLSLKIFYIFLFTSFLVAFFKINILILLKLDLLIPKVKIYLELLDLEDSEPVNVFNFRILFSLAILILFSIKVKTLEKQHFFLILFKIHILSLILFFILSPSAMVFSLRIYDMLSVVQLLLYPMIILVFKEKFVSYAFVFTFCAVNLYYLFKVSEWYNDYSSWLFDF